MLIKRSILVIFFIDRNKWAVGNLEINFQLFKKGSFENNRWMSLTSLFNKVRQRYVSQINNMQNLQKEVSTKGRAH